VRGRIRDIERATNELRLRLSRTPTDQEVADEAGLTLAELRKVRDRPTYFASASDEEMANVSDLAPHLDELFEVEDTRELLMQAVAQLGERDRIVIALYFFEGFTLGEIGLILDVTESRVSQLRTRAMTALRNSMTQLLIED